jgi:hypothetical protein
LKTQPRSQTVKAGHSAVFRVTAQGTGPLFYNWFHDGQWIFSNAKTIFSIPHVKPEDAGEYRIEILNNWSGATSTNAVLTVVP